MSQGDGDDDDDDMPNQNGKRTPKRHGIKRPKKKLDLTPDDKLNLASGKDKDVTPETLNEQVLVQKKRLQSVFNSKKKNTRHAQTQYRKRNPQMEMFATFVAKSVTNGRSIRVKLDSEIFEVDVTAYISLEDFQAIIYMKELTVNCIMLYIKYKITIPIHLVIFNCLLTLSLRFQYYLCFHILFMLFFGQVIVQ